MDKMLTVSELSSITEIPESTVRRYLNKFESYFRYDARGKGKKYHSDTIEILKQIAVLYGEGYQANEIESLLAVKFPFTVNDPSDATTQPPHKSIEQQFEEFKSQQAEFNRKLLEQLHQQQEYIKELLEEKRETDLLERPEENQPEEEEETAATNEAKKWWEFWKS